MKIRLIWVGKTKESFIKEGMDKYLRLLSPFCKVECVEIKDVREKDTGKSVAGEGARILKRSDDFVLLSEKGEELTSLQFAALLSKKNGIDFVVGGPYGVSKEVCREASAVLSLSKMTFTHEMARLLLLEQIYRAFTIMHKRGYHH